MTPRKHNLGFPRGKHTAFTLIELLLVIGIIAILAAIIITAINPSKQIGDARNAQRRSDVNTILNGVYQYTIDNEGTPPAGITDVPTEICLMTASCNHGISLDLLSGSYLAGMPSDPTADLTGTGTDYFISISENGRISVTAPNAESGISISR